MSNPQYPNQPPYQNQPPGGFPPPQQGGYQPQPGFAPPPPQGGYQPQQGGYQPQPGFAPPPQGYPQPGYPQAQYGYGAPVGPLSAPRATFGQRLGATIIDAIVIGIPIIIIEVIAFVVLVKNATTDPTTGVTTIDSNAATGTSALAVFLIPLILYVAYYLIMVGRGQTVGDKVAGIKIIDSNGNPPGFLKTFIRLIVQQVLGSIFFITYLWVLWDPDKQTLHDKAAGTICISAKG